MKSPPHNDPMDALGAIYEKMYEHTVENLHKIENKSTEAVHKLIDEAKDKAIKLENLSKKEAENLANYLKRDFNDTANYLSKTGKELKDWLGFETSLLENELLDLLLKAADTTTIDLLRLNKNTQHSSSYHADEVTGPGMLICDHCGKRLYFYKASRIKSCPKCNTTKFHRKNVHVE